MVIIILILFVEFSCSIEHLIQELRFRHYSKVTSELELLLKRGYLVDLKSNNHIHSDYYDTNTIIINTSFMFQIKLEHMD